MRNVTIFIFVTILSLAWTGMATAQTCDTSWENPVNGNWTDASNWTAGLPSVTAVACIDVDGTYEVTLSGTATAKALVLGLASGTGTPTLTFSSGTLTLSEPSVVRSTGRLNWNGGALAGTLTNAGLLRLTSTSTKTLTVGSTLTNDGTIEHAAGNLTFQNDVEVVNNATFDSQNDVNFSVQFNGERQFVNNGTFTKSGGTGVSTVSTALGSAFLAFDNNGTVRAEAGEIRLSGTSSLESTHANSVFEATSGALVNFAGGTHAIAGTVSGMPDGTVRISGGTMQDDGAGATINFGDTGLEWSGGTLAGTLTNAGLLRLTSTSTKTLTAGSTLTNDGTIEHAAGNLTFQNDVEVVNNATFDSQDNVDFTVQFPGTRRFVNNGSFTKSGGTGVSIVSALASGPSTLAFDNNGTVEAKVGEIRLAGAEHTHTDSVFEATSGALVNFAGGTHAIAGTVSGMPDGTVRISGGTMQDDGAGATINFGDTGLEWSGGTLAGTLTNAGLLRLTSTSTKTLTAGSTLTNDGTIEHAAGNLTFQNDVEVVNNATFDSQNDVSFAVSVNGNRQFVNNGTFTKSGGTGVSTVSTALGSAFLTFDNEPGGVVSAESGTVGANGPFVHAAGALIEGEGTFQRPLSSFTHAGDTGPGLSPGVLNWTGAFAPAPTATFIVDIAGSGGAGAATGHDRLDVSASAVLDGPIQVNLLDGFVPAEGAQFEVLTATSVSGTFTNPNANDRLYAGNGVAFTVIYESNRVLLVADLLEADIAVTKTVDAAVVDVEQTATFTVTASKGPAADDLSAFGLDEDIVISDLLPAGLSLVNATPSAGTYDSSTGAWQLPNLGAGTAETLTLEVTVDAAGELENTATLQAAELPDPDATNDSASATVEGQAADLALEKTVSASSVLVDEAFSFTVTLTNTGPNDASGIEIADAIPTGLACTVTPADGSYGDGLWTLASLAADASTTLVFNCTAETPGTYTNVATRQASSPIDLDDTNDEAEASIEVTAPATADLALEKTVSPSSVVVGDPFAFVVTLTNNGPEDATNIVVSDEIPTGLDCTVDAASGSYDDTSGAWSVAELADDASTTLTFDCTADAEGDVTNEASILESNPTDPNLDNNEAQATLTVNAPACPVPTFTQDASTVSEGFVTLTFSDPEGLVEVNFVDTEDNNALVNFEASTEAADFTTSDGINWSFSGAAGTEPTEVVFILTAVPPSGFEPGDQFTASYFAQATNGCGSTLDVDPVFTLSTQAPRALAILGNYPNPFADATTIRFDLPEAGAIQVQIFDLMGREVATLVDAPLGAGTHEVTWNGALSNGQAIASGLYLVRLQAGGQTTTQRITRVR